MPRQIRQLKADLRRAGFRPIQGGKGSHEKWIHPSGVTAIVPGHDGDDAKPYLERHVRAVIRESQERESGTRSDNGSWEG